MKSVPRPSRRSVAPASRPPGSVRVVAGRWRGLRLEVLPGEAIRPTADRVKEALFSILQPRLAGAVVVDAFAGTGALGIEALSRGAARVAFVENDRGSLALLRRNLDRLGEETAITIVAADALDPEGWGPSVLPADLILADPPYRRELGDALLAALAAAGALREDGLIVLEHEREHEPAHPAWTRTDCRHYGDTALSLFTPADAGR